MRIIGVGCGPGMMTEQAILELRSARIVYGSTRAIEIAQQHIPKNCSVRSISDYRNLSQLPENAIVLSTGDPMLAGLGYLSGEVIPGISSLQLAAARLHLPLSRFSVVVAHGRGHDRAMQETLEELRRDKFVFLIADPRFESAELYRRLTVSGLPPQMKIAVCENLGYPDEHILTGSISDPPPPGSDLYAMVIGSFG